MAVFTKLYIVTKNGSVLSPSKTTMIIQDALKELDVVTDLDSFGEPYFNRKMTMDFMEQCMIGRYAIFVPSKNGDVAFEHSKALKGQAFEERNITFYFSEYPLEDTNKDIPQPLKSAKSFLILSLLKRGVAVELLENLSAKLAKALPDHYVYFSEDDIKEDYKLIEN